MNDGLLIKFLLRETSPEENRKMEDWLRDRPHHQQQLNQVKWIWEQSKQVALENPVDSEDAWEKFKSIRDQGQPVPLLSIRPDRRWKLMNYRLIASVFLLLGALWGIYAVWIAPVHPYFSSLVFSAGSEPKQAVLPDGTGITLNKQASLQYTESLLGRKRLVSMTGEVFFDIKQEVNKPFEVHTGDLEIQVLGTSFNVKANRKGTEVIVESGQVQIKRADLIIRLKPNEKATVRAGIPGIAQELQTDHLFNYYRTKRFELNATPLWRFAEILSEAYNVSIKIENPAIAALPITTTFEQDSLSNIIRTLTETLQIKAVREGNTLVLKK